MWEGPAGYKYGDHWEPSQRMRAHSLHGVRPTGREYGDLWEPSQRLRALSLHCVTFSAIPSSSILWLPLLHPSSSQKLRLPTTAALPPDPEGPRISFPALLSFVAFFIDSAYHFFFASFILDLQRNSTDITESTHKHVTQPPRMLVSLQFIVTFHLFPLGYNV